MTKFFLILTIFITIFSCTNTPKGYSLRTEAKKLTKNKSFEGAIQLLEKALEINPKYDTVLYNLGVNHLNLKQEKKGIEYLNKTIKINNKYTKAYILLANISKEDSTCLKHLLSAYSFSKDEKKKGSLKYKTGNIYRKQLRYQKAVESYKTAIIHSPKKLSYYNNIGISYFHLNQFDKAIVNYQKAISIDKNDHNAYINQGNVFVKMGEYKKAIKSFKTSNILNPNNYKNLYNLGNSYQKNKQYNEAILAFNKVILLGYEDAMTLCMLALTQSKAGKKNESCETLEKLSNLGKRNNISLDIESVNIEYSKKFSYVKNLKEALEVFESDPMQDADFYYYGFQLQKQLCYPLEE